MVLESGTITQEGIDRLRARLGSFNRPRQYGVGLFNEEASRSAIRHFCQGIGDTNPLYWDMRLRPADQVRQNYRPGLLPLQRLLVLRSHRRPARRPRLPRRQPTGSGSGPSTWTTRFPFRSSSLGWRKRKASSPVAS